MQTQSVVTTILGTQYDPLLTPAEASEYLGVSVDTLSVWRCVGRYGIPYVKIGRLVKYRRSALDTFINSRTHDAAV